MSSALFGAALALLRLRGLPVGLISAVGAWLTGRAGAPGAAAGVVAVFAAYARGALHGRDASVSPAYPPPLRDDGAARR